MDTSTSYMDAMNMGIGDLFDFFDTLQELTERRYPQKGETVDG